VYKLGQAGDVKKVADGYARNYLLPLRLGVPATKGAIGVAHRARAAGAKLREQEAKDKAGIAEQLGKLRITFPVQANEEGRLYGSVTNQMLAEAIEAACGEKIDRRSIMSAGLRETGEHQVPVRLTADLVPNVTAVLYRDQDEIPTLDDTYQEPVTDDQDALKEEADPDDTVEQQPDI
jgi:large subunit ribosomal protein L9